MPCLGNYSALKITNELSTSLGFSGRLPRRDVALVAAVDLSFASGLLFGMPPLSGFLSNDSPAKPAVLCRRAIGDRARLNRSSHPDSNQANPLVALQFRLMLQIYTPIGSRPLGEYLERYVGDSLYYCCNFHD